MLKVMGLLHRRSDLDLPAFSRHWRTIHRDLALLLVSPGLMRGYVQNHRIGVIEGLPIAADGVPELWVDGVEQLLELPKSRAYLDGAALDEPRFMDVGNYRNLLLTPETRIDDGPGRQAVAPLVKAMIFVRPADGLDLAAFRMWETLPHPLFMPGARPLRLGRHSIADPSPELPPPDFLGVETSWWPTVAAFERAWASHVPDACGGFTAFDRAEGMLVGEEPVLWPSQLVDRTVPESRL